MILQFPGIINGGKEILRLHSILTQIEEEIARAKKLGVDDYQIGEMTS